MILQSPMLNGCGVRSQGLEGKVQERSQKDEPGSMKRHKENYRSDTRTLHRFYTDSGGKE
jgi:hypothetical protein